MAVEYQMIGLCRDAVSACEAEDFQRCADILNAPSQRVVLGRFGGTVYRAALLPGVLGEKMMEAIRKDAIAHELLTLAASENGDDQALDTLKVTVKSSVLSKEIINCLSSIEVVYNSIAGEDITAKECDESWKASLLTLIPEAAFHVCTDRFIAATKGIDDRSLTTEAAVQAVLRGEK